MMKRETMFVCSKTNYKIKNNLEECKVFQSSTVN